MLLFNAPAGIVNVILPSGEVREPPAALISLTVALPIGFPIAVGKGVTASAVDCLPGLSFLQLFRSKIAKSPVTEKKRSNFRSILVVLMPNKLKKDIRLKH